VSLLLLRDLEGLAVILALPILSVLLLAATRRRSAPAEAEGESEP
jgi:hypothetical protein